MWHCPAAQDLWRQLRSGWTRLGVTTTATADEFCTAVFSLRLPQTPAAAWTVLGLEGVDTDLIPLVHALVATVRQQQILGYLEQIWRWRHGVNDEALLWTATVASSALRGSMRRAFYQATTSLPVPHKFEHPLRRLLHGLESQQLGEETRLPMELCSGTD